jgi:hypothetical protein
VEEDRAVSSSECNTANKAAEEHGVSNESEIAYSREFGNASCMSSSLFTILYCVKGTIPTAKWDCRHRDGGDAR